MVDHHVLNCNQHQKNHCADDVVSANHEVAESLNHIARGRGSGIAVEQDQARRRDIQRQAEQGE